MLTEETGDWNVDSDPHDIPIETLDRWIKEVEPDVDGQLNSVIVYITQGEDGVIRREDDNAPIEQRTPK